MSQEKELFNVFKMGNESTEFKTTENQAISRLTAYKVWLSDIKDKEFKQKEAASAYVEAQGRNVSRVNIVASVVDKYESEKYSSLTLDDSSAQMRLKAFGDSIQQLKGVETGDIIITIARLRNFNNENYLYPEIVKKVSSKHALLRKLELTIEHGKREQHQVPVQTTPKQAALPATAPKPQQQEIKPVNTLKEKIKVQLAKLDEGEGVEVTSLQASLEENQEEIRKVLDGLVGEGEAYEPRPGKFKLI